MYFLRHPPRKPTGWDPWWAASSLWEMSLPQQSRKVILRRSDETAARHPHLVMERGGACPCGKASAQGVTGPKQPAMAVAGEDVGGSAAECEGENPIARGYIGLGDTGQSSAGSASHT